MKKQKESRFQWHKRSDLGVKKISLNQYAQHELTTWKRNNFNRAILGTFLLLVFATFIMKFTAEILTDLGFAIDGTLHIGWWNDPDILARAAHEEWIANLLARRPHLFWSLTQFTWLTTYLTLAFLFLRFFKHDVEISSRFRWIVSQRTLSLISTYSAIVAIVYWTGDMLNAEQSFSPHLYTLELIATIFVHALIPIALNVYAIIYQIHDRKSSLLREKFVLKGMLYPTVYMLYYLLISAIWYDPYPITNFHNGVISDIWKVFVMLVIVYILLGLILLLHNWLLLHYNKHYNSGRDYGVYLENKHRIEKAKHKAFRKFIKDNHINWKF